MITVNLTDAAGEFGAELRASMVRTLREMADKFEADLRESLGIAPDDIEGRARLRGLIDAGADGWAIRAAFSVEPDQGADT